MLGVDRCDIGGWFGVRRHQAGLFAMTDKVLQVLYCAHGGGGESGLGLECEGRRGRGKKRAKRRMPERKSSTRKEGALRNKTKKEKTEEIKKRKEERQGMTNEVVNEKMRRGSEKVSVRHDSSVER